MSFGLGPFSTNPCLGFLSGTSRRDAPVRTKHSHRAPHCFIHACNFANHASWRTNPETCASPSACSLCIGCLCLRDKLPPEIHSSTLSPLAANHPNSATVLRWLWIALQGHYSKGVGKMGLLSFQTGGHFEGLTSLTAPSQELHICTSLLCLSPSLVASCCFLSTAWNCLDCTKQTSWLKPRVKELRESSKAADSRDRFSTVLGVSYAHQCY